SAEDRAFIARVNDTARAIPAGARVDALVRAAAARDPSALAVSGGDERLTYGELVLRADALAEVLRDRGVGRDAHVATVVDRSPPWIVAMLAAMFAGGAFVPLDPAHPDARLAWLVEDSDARVIVASRRHAARLAGAADRIVVVEDAPPMP